MRLNATVLRRLGVSIAVGGLAVSIPWLAAKTDVEILANWSALLMLPGIIPGMIFGARYGGGIHDISFPATLIGSAAFYSLVTYLWLRWRGKRRRAEQI